MFCVSAPIMRTVPHGDKRRCERLRIVVGLAVYSACVPVVGGEEPPAKPNAKVELRWVADTLRGSRRSLDVSQMAGPKVTGYPTSTTTKATVIENPAVRLRRKPLRGSAEQAQDSESRGIHLVQNVARPIWQDAEP